MREAGGDAFVSRGVSRTIVGITGDIDLLAVTLNLAIGQGENAQTLIDMVRLYQMLAGDGKSRTPYLVRPTSEPQYDFKLTPDQYVRSTRLREWARRNKNSKYIPEALLEAWGFEIESTL